jgi:hypothetical protein
MKISYKFIGVVLVLVLSLFSLYGITFQVSDGLFSIKNVETEFKKSIYYLDFDIEKEVRDDVVFDIEIINKEENLVVESLRVECRSTICSERIEISGTLFGEHEISIVTKYERYFYKQKKSFILKEEENTNYQFIIPKKIELTEDSFGAIFKGKIITTKSSEFTIEYFPKSFPDERSSFTLACLEECVFEKNLSQPLILGDYQVNVYTSLGESLHIFTLGYFEEGGINTGSLENDDTELETSIELNIKKNFIEQEDFSIDTQKLFNDSTQKNKIEKVTKKVTKIELDGTTSVIEVKNGELLNINKEDSFILIDENLNTRTQSNTKLKSLEFEEITKNLEFNEQPTFTNLNTQEEIVFSEENTLIPGIYKEEFNDGTKNYFALGLVSINTQKSLYKKDSIMKFIIVVLDSKGFLISSSNITLDVISPDGSIEFLSSDLRSITESKKNGVYFGFMNATEVGEYTLLVNTNVDGYALTRESYVNVVDAFDYEILRNVPATIDPFIGPFKNEFFLSTLFENQGVLLKEKLPSSFEIVDTNADRIEVDDERGVQFLFWDNVTSLSDIFYYSQTPLLTPYLYELGRATIDFGSGLFIENRSWLFAIDPLVSGTQTTCTSTFGADCSAWPATSEGDNTFDTCPTSIGGANDEHVNEVTLSSDIVYVGDSINVTCDFDPFSAGTEEYIYYYNTTDWTQIYSGNAPDGNVHLVSATILVDDAPGDHYVRCIVDWDGENDFCAETGQYYDNDDASFRVISKFLNVTSPTNSSYNSPLIPLSITTTQLSDMSYSIDSGVFRNACSDCTSFDDTLFLGLGGHSIEIRAIDTNTLQENVWIESFSVLNDDINPPANTSENTCTNTFGETYCGLWPSTSEGDNTFDVCPTSIGGAADEHVQEVYVNSSLVYGGATVSVTCTIDPFDAGTEEYLYYYNTTGWTQIYSGNAPDGNIHNISASVTIDFTPGTHYFRCIADWDGENDFCADGGSYYDNDDVALEVIEEVVVPFSLTLSNPLPIEYTTPLVTFSGLISKNVSISYQLDSGLVTPVCANCTSFSVDQVFRNGNFSLIVFAEDGETLQVLNESVEFSVNVVDVGSVLNSSGNSCSDTFGFDCSLWPSASEGDNTFDSCSSSLGNAGDENVLQTLVNMSAVLVATEVEVTCNYDPYDANTEEYIYYYNTTGWTQIYSGNAPDGNIHSVTRTVVVDNVSGTHYFRCIVDYDGENDFCANEGQYYDNDDVSVEVFEPIILPYLVTLSSPQNTTYLDTTFIVDAFSTKNSDFSYQLNSGSFTNLCLGCTSVLSNITLPGGEYLFTLRAEDTETFEVIFISRNLSLISPLNVTYSNFNGNTTDLSTVLDITNVCDLVLENSSAGKISFNECINADNVDLDSNIAITDSFINLNSVFLPNYNRSAILTFYGIDVIEPLILKNNNDVCGDCTILSYVNSTLQINVSSFSSFTIVENRSFEIFDYSDFFPVGINSQVGFFANYSYVNTSIINDATCLISYNTNGTFGPTLPMTYNSSIGVYDDYRTFPIAGTFDFNVSCTHPTYPQISLVDSVLVSPPSTLTIDLIQPSLLVDNIYVGSIFEVQYNISCVGALTCSGIDLTLAYDGAESIGESGSVSLSNNNRQVIEFTKPYLQIPVAILTPASDTDSDNNALIPVIHSINTTAMEISLCEDAGATTCSTSVESELVHYMVFDIDVANQYSWIDVGRVNGVPTDGSDTSFVFSSTFTNIPSVFAQAQTYSSVTNQIASSGWSDTVTTSGAQLIGCDHPGTANTCGGTFSETYGYVAIDMTLHDITSLSSGTQSISNSAWTPIVFGQTYTSAIISVFQNSDTGAQDPQYPWAQNVGSTGADVRYCEQDAIGVCDSHSAEIIHWFSVEEGILFTSATSGNSVSSIAEDFPLFVDTNPQSFSVSAGTSTLRNFSLQTTAPQDSLYTLFGITNYGPVSSNFSVIVRESNLDATLITPISMQSVVQNETFDVQIALNCTGSCQGVDVELLVDGLLITNVTASTPFEIIGSQLLSCNLGIDGNCLVSFSVNATGPINMNYTISAQILPSTLDSFVTNSSEITIVSGPQISFGTSSLLFTNVIANYQDQSQDVNLFGSVVDHTNVNIFCEGGDCSSFISTFSNGGIILESNITPTSFVCSPSSEGNYSATFRVTSTQDGVGDVIILDCSATELPLFLTLQTPDPDAQFDITQNDTFSMIFNVTCNDVVDCNNVNLTLYYEQDSIGEAGSVSLANFETKSISFSRDYSSVPIIIAVPASDVDSDNNALIPVITSITTSGFDIALCEDAGATTCSSSVEEELVHYMVFDSIDSNVYSWIDVGVVSNVVTNGVDTPFTFGKTFTNVPFVFAQVQGDNDGGSAMAPSGWIDGLTTVGGALIACDHPGTADVCAGSTTEDYGYVAIDFLSANLSAVSSGTENIANSAWTSVSFTESYSNPIIAVYQNSDTGGQDPQYPWARSVTSTQADVRYCEQDGLGDCDTHSGEDVSWFVLEEGLILVGDKDFSIVPTFSANIPFYSNKNPDIFNVSQNSSVLISFLLNATGQPDELYSIYGELGNMITSDALSIRILGENQLDFLDTSLLFDDVFQTEGNEITSTSLFSKYGNTGTILSCISGNCSSFSTSWIGGNSLVENQSSNIFFTCLDSVAGNLTATYEVSSVEVSNGDTIVLNCNVLVKSLDIDLVNPLPFSTTQMIQNTTLNISVNITCQDVLGCPSINASLLFDDLSKTWFNRSYNFRQVLSLVSPATTTNNFVFLVELNSTTIGSSFDWSTNCEDLLFVSSSGGVELDYYVDYCNSGSQIARVFVESNVPLINLQPYSIEMYYGNSLASSRSNGNSTFLFYEDFEGYSGLLDGVIPTGWNDLLTGDVRLTTELDSNRALLKTINNDPNGGFIDLGFTISNYELYIKTNRINAVGGAANRYSVTDGLGNGYGPYTTNYGAATQFRIEERTTNTGSTLVAGSNFATTQNAWYTQRFSYFNQDIEFDFFDSTYSLLNSVSGNDNSFSSFSRFNIHGGNEFLTDDIFVREYFGVNPNIAFSIEENIFSLIENSSSTPLFIEGQNPQTISLLNGESIILDFLLNATGNINTTYDIFGELSNGDRTQFTTIEIVAPQNFETNLSLEFTSTYLGGNTYLSTLILGNLLEDQTTLDRNITLHVYVPDTVNLGSFDVGSSLRYSVDQSFESLVDVYSTNGTIYEFELSSLLGSQGVFSAFTGTRTLDNSWVLEFNVTSTLGNNFFKDVLVAIE